MLFFGCRNSKKDFFFREQWRPLVESGSLKLFTAFSRDQVHITLVYCFFQRYGTYHTRVSVTTFSLSRTGSLFKLVLAIFLIISMCLYRCLALLRSDCFSLLQQEDKIYVQHKLLDNSSVIWDLLTHKQGWFYIAGYDEWSLSHGFNIACAAVAVFFPNLARGERKAWEPSNGLRRASEEKKARMHSSPAFYLVAFCALRLPYLPSFSFLNSRGRREEMTATKDRGHQ